MSKNDPWYRVGYALELARQHLPAVREGSDAAAEDTRRGSKPSLVEGDALDHLISIGTTTVVSKLIGALPGRPHPGVLRLVRAALAGAGAAAVLALVRSRLRDDGPSPDPVGELLAGAGRGILYGSALEPHLPGPAGLRGATFALLEYTAAPWGGMDGVLGAASPKRTLPMLGALLGSDAVEAETITEHLVFGCTLGILYGAAKASSGIDPDE